MLCGHRGSGRGVVGGRPENTLGSCRAAVGAGLRRVAVDARLTAPAEAAVLVAAGLDCLVVDRAVSSRPDES